MLNGMLWILRTGAPWRDLPARYGKVQSVFSRFRRWREQGIWSQIFASLQSIAQAEGRIDKTASLCGFHHCSRPPACLRSKSGDFGRGGARTQPRRLLNRLKQFRRAATRYEKRAANYLAMLTLTLAAINLWL